MELADKVAIVTGGSRGIGKGYALALAKAGASVVVASRTAKEVLPAGPLPRGDRHVKGYLAGTIYQTAKEIEALGGKSLPVRCDVSKEDDVKAMVAQALEHFGKIDILVNNAAIYPRYHYLEFTPEAFDLSFHVNVLGPYLCCKHVLPHMIKQRSGNIINITSRGAIEMPRTYEVARNTNFYAITKAALNRMTTLLAEEVAEYGIAINALAPGAVKTDGLADSMPPEYDFNDGFGWKDPTPEYLGPPLIFLAQQTAQTFTGKAVNTGDFRKTWP